MTSISVALRDPDLGMTIEAGAAARLRRIAGPGGRTTTHGWSWSGAVPAGAGAGRRVPLDAPGIYEIEIVLPSGRVLAEQHEVSEGEDLRVAFLAEGSRDWLADGGILPEPAFVTPEAPLLPVTVDDWILGGAAAGSGMRASLNGPQSTSSEGVPARSFGAPYGRSAPSSPPLTGKDEMDGALSAVIVAGRRPDFSSWDAVGGLKPGLDKYEVLRSLLTGFDRVTHLPFTRLGRQGGASCWRLTPSSHPQDERAFAVLSTVGGVEIAFLPFPGMNEPGRLPPEVEVTLDESDANRAFRTQVMVREGLVGGLLAYLSRGNMHGARTILDDLTSGREASIVERNDAPLATAAAAYVSLATESVPEAGPGDKQLRDLMERHPWLPDGAILFARRKLRFAQATSDIEVARRALRLAYHRGLPFFSAGVENLADALALAASGDPELEAMGRTVSAGRVRIDPGQAFTVLRVG